MKQHEAQRKKEKSYKTFVFRVYGELSSHLFKGKKQEKLEGDFKPKTSFPL